MGLEAFRPDDVELGDTYYKITLRGEATANHHGLPRHLHRELQQWSIPNVEFSKGPMKVVIPFELSARGNSAPLATEAAESKLESMRKAEFNDGKTSIVYLDVMEKTVEEIEVDW